MLIPNAQFAISLVAFVVALSVAGLALLKRQVTGRILEDNSQAIGGTLGTLSLLYAVIVGSVVASGWNRFNAAQSSLNHEASKLGDLLRMAQAFAEPARSDFQTALLRYAESVVAVEWPIMSRGEVVLLSTPQYEAPWTLFLDYRPQDSHEEVFFNHALGQLNDLGENRRLRVLSTQEQLSVPMWILFIAGGVLVIGYTYFFPSKHHRFHALKTTSWLQCSGWCYS
jgi:hypothetical protein